MLWYLHKLYGRTGILLSVISTGIFVCSAFSQDIYPDISLPFSAEKDTSFGMFPYDWKDLRGKGTTYTVERGDTGIILHAFSHSGNASIIKRMNCAIQDYPFLSWKWKAVQLPPEGRETEKKKNDSSAGIYVAFKSGLFFKALKYVWSTSLPKGTVTSSPYNSSVKIIVLESGKENEGKWVSERVDIKGDVGRYFSGGLSEIIGIGIMTDSDNTKSIAEAYYADLRLSHNVNGSNPGGGAFDK